MSNIIDFYDREKPDKLYYGDGSLVVPAKFKPPKNGICKLFTNDRILYMEISYQNKRKNGKTKIYWGYSGTPLLHYELSYKNDVLDGTVTTYYSDGAFKETEEYKNGRRIRTLERRKEWHVDDWYYL